MLTALFGMLALAMDLGRAWNLETELQHAADACALAGTTQLDGSDGARVRAIEACVTKVYPPFVANEQRFASDGLGADVTFSDDTTIDEGSGIAINPDIRFYSILPTIPANLATSDADARFIEANVAPRRVDFSFAAVVGAVDSANPRARAVAGWETMNCARPQMMMCNPNEDPAGNPNADFNMYQDCQDYGDGRGVSCVGRGVTLKSHGNSGGGQLINGNYGFLSLSVLDNEGNIIEKVTGANALKDTLAAVNPANTCTGNHFLTEPGNMASLGRYINMRFDIYFDDNKVGYRSNYNYRSAPNVVKNLVLPAGWSEGDRCQFNTTSGSPDGPGSSDWQWPADRYDGPGHHPIDPATGAIDAANPIYTTGLPRDMCAYPPESVVVAIGDPDQESVKDGYDSTQVIGGIGGCIFAPKKNIEGLVADGDQIGSGQWDIETYLAVHHPTLTVSDLLDATSVNNYADLPNALDDPKTAGIDESIAPDGFISRWEMYRWEMTNYPNNMAVGGSGAEGGPVCYQGAEYDPLGDPVVSAAPDRRIIFAAVTNCASLKGGRKAIKGVDTHGVIALFLTEPMGGFDQDAIYAEIVDPASITGLPEEKLTIVRERILLIE